MTATIAPSIAPELHIVTRVGGERFAFPVAHVEEAIDAPDVGWVPVSPDGMLGQLLHRGRTLAAWDAGSVFRLGRQAEAGAAIVLRDGARFFALVVDDVMEMTRIAPAGLRAVPGGADADGVLAGVCFADGEEGLLVNVVRVDAVAALVSRRGTPGDGMTR